MRSRAGVFALLATACTLVAVGAVVSAVMAQRKTAAAPAARTAQFARPYVVFRAINKTAGPEHMGELTSTPASDPGSTRRPTGRLCERVYAVPSGGICIARSRSLTGAYEAQLIGPDGRVRHKIGLDGVPSRTRVSADGRYGATTTFVTGDSYAKPGAFSTQTLLLDMGGASRSPTWRRSPSRGPGSVVDAADVQFWGVTFARASDTFYATLATGGKTYLVKGSVSSRTGRVIRDNVECPSLSPDGTRIGYKQLVGRRGDMALPRARPRLRRRRRAGGDAVGRRSARVAGRPQPALPRGR